MALDDRSRTGAPHRPAGAAAARPRKRSSGWRASCRGSSTTSSGSVSSTSTGSSRPPTWSRSRTCSGADEPRPSLAARAGARPRARPRRRLLPRSISAGVTERPARADGRRGARRDRGRRALRRRVLRRLRGRRGATSSAPICGGPRSRARAEDGGEPLRGVPVAVKDIFCTEGVRRPPARGSSRATGRRTRRRPCAGSPRRGRAVLGKTNMDEFAMGSSNENSAYGAGAQPLGPRAGARRLLGRLGGGGRRPAWRPGRSAPTPAARSASPPRSAGSSG